MERKEWALLAIAAAGEKGLSPVQLQKSLFLLEKESDLSECAFYDFALYSYGPFDPDVFRDAEELAVDELVSIRPVPGRRWSTFHITEGGKERATALEKCATSHVLECMKRAVAWTQARSFTQLVKGIYERFPAYKANSIFVG